MKSPQAVEVLDFVKALEGNHLGEKLLFSNWDINIEKWEENIENFLHHCYEKMDQIRHADLTLNAIYYPLKKMTSTIAAIDGFLMTYINMHGKTEGDSSLKRIYSYQDRLRFIANQIWSDKEVMEKIRELAGTIREKHIQEILHGWIKHKFESYITPENKQKNFKFSQKLDQITREFEQNGKQALWKKNYALIVPPNRKYWLEGVEEYIKEGGRFNAIAEGKKGWLFYVEDFTADALLRKAKHRDFRKKVYQTYQKLNSDQRMLMNNDALLREILATKQQIAKIYGKKNYSELVLSGYVLNTPKKAYDYLENMQHELNPLVEKTREEMLRYANRDQITELKAWDLPYYYEEVKSQYKFRQKDVFMEYFSFEDVMPKLMRFFARQLDVSFSQVNHPLATKENGFLCYRMKDRRTARHGYLLISPYTNPAKEGPQQNEVMYGEDWGNGVVSHSIQYVSLDLQKGKKRTAMSMYNLYSLLHELGHAIHAFFGNLDDWIHNEQKMSWDLIELPSQFMEYLIYDRHFIYYMSAHYLTGKRMPEHLLQEMIEKEHFFKGYEIYQDIQKYRAHLWLHENFKPYSRKNPHQIVEEKLATEGIIYNIARDQYMSYTEPTNDYAPAGYVYLYSAQLAFQIFEFYVDNEAYYQPYALRNIFGEIFNSEKTTPLKHHLEKFVDLYNVNMMKFLKKTWNIDLYGTTLWHKKQHNLGKIIMKENE